jgi:energy-coupling factor transport system permease protein
MAKIWVLITIPTFFILILNWVFVSQVIDHLLLMVLRFWGMTWLFNWFLKQVEPDDLAKALWALHIPYNFAWQISLAYRFIPMFQEETQNIYNIQISRGIPLDGNIFVKLKYLPSMSVPLIVMAQDKANLFSEALFARNWNANSPKTVLNPLKLQIRDWLLLGIILCGTLLSLFPPTFI